MALECQLCTKLEVRNISIDLLQETGGWSPDFVNPAAIESWLNFVDARDPKLMLAHRKTKLEIFHSAPTLARLVDSGSDNSDGPIPAALDTLCAFCRHLNLKHLCTYTYNCVMELTLGRLEDIHSRPECSLCAFFSKSIATTFPASSVLDSAWIVKTVYLRFASEETNNDSGLGRKTYLCLSGESTEVLLRVQDVTDFEQAASETQSTHSNLAPRPITPLVDWDRFRNLASSCFENHLECRSAGTGTFPPGFRLIHVKQRRMVRIRSDEVPYYGALSYVWGKNPDNEYLSTRETIDEFEREGSLSGLPRTIEDSLEVCFQLGIPYIWVDRLCIVQDDDVHKSQQIDAMATIYRAAEIVIVAASSSNLHEGLAGVSKRRSSQPELLLQDGVKVVASLPRFADVMQHLTWQTRGWTYQEAVLGRRKLYLTPVQTFFDCGEGRLVIAEDAFAEGSTYGMSLETNRFNTLWQYYFHVDKYNQRSLRYHSDVYNAIQGIMQVLYLNQPLYFGLPGSDFDQALLWRSRSQPRPVNDEVTMPAWSWSSMNSTVARWPYLYLGALVSWSICTENSLGGTELVPSKAISSPQTWLEWTPEFTCQTFCPQLAMAIAWSKQCIESEEPFRQLYNSEFTISELQAELCALWPTYEDFWNAAFADSAAMIVNVKSSLRGALLPGTLVGRVQLRSFSVSRHERCAEGCIHDGRLQINCTSSRKPAGMLEQPHPDLESIHARSDSLYFAALSISEWQVYEECFDWIPRDPNLRRFSARSREHMDTMYPRRLWDARARLFHQSGLENLEDNLKIWSLNAKYPSERPPLLVNVMVIDVDGPTARYVCKGWVFLSVWSTQSGRFRTVAISPEGI